MSNKHKGEVSFTLGKVVYTLRFSINAMCELEEALGNSIINIAELMSDPKRLGMRTVRAVFWAALRDDHAAVTHEHAGRLMDEIGLVKASGLIAEAFHLAFPEAEASRPLEGAPQGQSTGKAH